MKDKIIHIFFASARDAASLLERAKHEVELINALFSTQIPISIKIHEWKNVSANMGNPEGEILNQINIENMNIFVEVFRYSYGVPTGNINPDTGDAFKSGMEEEFYYAYKSWLKNRTPDVVILKSEEAIPRAQMSPTKNFDELEHFFEEFKGEGSHPGLYNTFIDEEQFCEVFRKNIMSRIMALIFEMSNDKMIGIGGNCRDLGYKDMFLEETNDQRNKCKTEQIRNTKQLRLRARSCHSFISYMGMFHAEIDKALERGMKFKIIMQNPWSLNSVYAALGEQAFKDKTMYRSYLKKKLSADKILDVFTESHWYIDRFQASIKGYMDLRKKYGSNITLKVSDEDLSNSVLLSDDELFFEPYLNSVKVRSKTLSLFELRVAKEAALYEDASEDFEKLWTSSYSFKQYTDNIDKFRDRVYQYLNFTI